MLLYLVTQLCAKLQRRNTHDKRKNRT
uniref:Uncharacterized protein n=1 Tax=Arundo donax TaxID=35708 RepID=A0A0A9FT61_ARUDO